VGGKGASGKWGWECESVSEKLGFVQVYFTVFSCNVKVFCVLRCLVSNVKV